MKEKMVIVLLLDRLNEWFLEKWVEHFLRFRVPIVCCVECCSTEAYEILKGAGVECYFWGAPWNGSLVRNFIIAATLKKYNPEWVMLTHADEIFEESIFEDIKLMLDDEKINWYSFPIYHLWGDENHYRNDGHWAKMDVMRIWRNHVLPMYTFGNPTQIHHVQSAPNSMRQLSGERSVIRVKHYSFVNPEAWRAKCFVRGKKWANFVEEEKNIELVSWAGEAGKIVEFIEWDNKERQ